MPGEGDLYPHQTDPYPEDPRDARFDALCALYLQADEKQRAQIPRHPRPRGEHAGLRAYRRLENFTRAGQRRPVQHDLLHAPRGKLHQIRDHAWRLRLGLAAAAILQEREDYRDIIVSLAFLYQAATRAGINPEPPFLEVAGLAEAETGRFIERFLERDSADIEHMVEDFS